MRPFYIVVACIACCCLAACAPKQQAEGGMDSTATRPAVVEPKEKWMVLKYDDLRLRDAPSKTGAVLATFKEGTQVLALGEQSPNEETVELRGEKITAHWLKVRSADGKEGWIFGGALAPAPDPSVANLELALKKLDRKDCKSIHAAIETYANAMKGKSPEIADQAYVPLVQCLEEIVEMQNGELTRRPGYNQIDMKFSPMDGQKIEPKYKAEKEAWEACGLELRFPEGMLDLELKPGLVIPALEPLVSKNMRRYLEIRKKEESHIWMEDAGVIITPKELADRAVTWDVFLTENPDFPMRPEIARIRDEYAITLLTGSNNTPVFDYETGKLGKEWKEAWDWVLKSNPQTTTGKLVQQWTDILKANNWKRGPQAEKFLADYWKAHE